MPPPPHPTPRHPPNTCHPHLPSPYDVENASAISTPLRWIFKNVLWKLVTHVESHTESAWEWRIALYKSNQQQQQNSIIVRVVIVTVLLVLMKLEKRKSALDLFSHFCHVSDRHWDNSLWSVSDLCWVSSLWFVSFCLCEHPVPATETCYK